MRLNIIHEGSGIINVSREVDVSVANSTILNNNKVIKRVKQWLSKSPHNINIIFGSQAQAQHDVVTIVITSHEGRHLLTPWLIIHQAAHAIIDDVGSAAGSRRTASKGYNKWYSIIEPLIGVDDSKDEENWYNLMSMCTFGSARNFRLSNVGTEQQKEVRKNRSLSFGEIPVEMLTQYITSGKVSLDPTTAIKPVDSKLVNSIASQLTKSFDNMMKNAVGKVFYRSKTD